MPSAPIPPVYVARPVTTAAGLVDVRLELPGRVWTLAGRGGPAAEAERALAAVAAGGLPVFVGAGLGAGLAAVRRAVAGPLFVLDRETAIAAATGVKDAWAADPSVHFLDDADPDIAASQVADAARRAGFAKLALVLHPVYRRLDPAWYGAVVARLKRYTALRQRLRRPRFTTAPPRVLLLRRPYFLYREIEAALDRLGIPWQSVTTGSGDRGDAGTVAAILEASAALQPDFALTVNHLGFDREGRLAALLEEMGLPLASWFVDSPRLILHDRPNLATPLTMIFSYDADALPELAAGGYAHTAWLPLGTDPERFRPGRTPEASWRADVSFVGESMERQSAEALARLPATSAMAAILPDAARAFVTADEKNARRFLESRRDWANAYAALPGDADRLQAELALTWEATRRYRQDCVSRLLPFSPLVAGDAGWRRALPGEGRRWRRLAPLDYYEALPAFYPASAVNFNCTSLQMKGAVNQRVFDVPACGGFVLTDEREQLAALFTPGTETAVYRSPEEIPELLRHYLAHPDARRRITDAARARILACHTYERRIETLCATMRATFGSR